MHGFNGFRGRGWGYVGSIFLGLRKRMKIKEFLGRDIGMLKVPMKKRRVNSLPFTVPNTGRRTAVTPDYWNWGIK